MLRDEKDILRIYGTLLLAGFKLTLRQSEIFILLASGKKNKEIAALLFIDYDTVRTHRARIFKRLAVKNKFELGMLAYKLGLL